LGHARHRDIQGGGLSAARFANILWAGGRLQLRGSTRSGEPGRFHCARPKPSFVRARGPTWTSSSKLDSVHSGSSSSFQVHSSVAGASNHRGFRDCACVGSNSYVVRGWQVRYRCPVRTSSPATGYVAHTPPASDTQQVVGNATDHIA
jgi:hypothetical protein